MIQANGLFNDCFVFYSFKYRIKTVPPEVGPITRCIILYVGGFLMKKKVVRCSLESKLQAVRLVCAWQSIAAVTAALGLEDQNLNNWLKAARGGRL